jgi:hypothetical protein
VISATYVTVLDYFNNIRRRAQLVNLRIVQFFPSRLIGLRV